MRFAPRAARTGALMRSLVALAIVGAASLLLATPAASHEVRRVGDLEMVVGWLEEPSYAGFKNGIDVFISRRGEPVEDAELTVTVTFGEPGSGASTEPLPLEAAFGEAGAYDTSIIPTRPGTYTFQISGTVAGRQIDETFTSGPEFDDVRNPADAQFPERDPTAGEIAQRLDQIDARLAESGGGSSTLALIIAAVAVVLALGAIGLALRRRA